MYKWSSRTSVLWFEIMLKCLCWNQLPECSCVLHTVRAVHYLSSWQLWIWLHCQHVFSIYPLYACVMDYDFHNSFTQTHSPHKTELEHWGKKSKPSNGAWLPSCSYEQNMDITPLKLCTQRHLDLYLGCPPFIQCGQAWILICAAAFNTYWYCTLGSF